MNKNLQEKFENCLSGEIVRVENSEVIDFGIELFTHFQIKNIEVEIIFHPENGVWFVYIPEFVKKLQITIQEDSRTECCGRLPKFCECERFSGAKHYVDIYA